MIPASVIIAATLLLSGALRPASASLSPLKNSELLKSAEAGFGKRFNFKTKQEISLLKAIEPIERSKAFSANPIKIDPSSTSLGIQRMEENKNENRTD